jgi:hypothetical protein
MQRELVWAIAFVVIVSMILLGVED